ncbi:unnamed protein product [Jaminaea pallidilutea]
MQDIGILETSSVGGNVKNATATASPLTTLTLPQHINEVSAFSDTEDSSSESVADDGTGSSSSSGSCSEGSDSESEDVEDHDGSIPAPLGAIPRQRSAQFPIASAPPGRGFRLQDSGDSRELTFSRVPHDDSDGDDDDDADAEADDVNAVTATAMQGLKIGRSDPSPLPRVVSNNRPWVPIIVEQDEGGSDGDDCDSDADTTIRPPTVTPPGRSSPPTSERSAASHRLFAALSSREGSDAPSTRSQPPPGLSVRRGTRQLPSLDQLRSKIAANSFNVSPSPARASPLSALRSATNRKTPVTSGASTARDQPQPRHNRSVSCPMGRVDLSWRFGDMTVMVTPPTPQPQPKSPIMGYVLQNAGHPVHPVKFRRSKDDLDLLQPPVFELAPGRQKVMESRAQEAMANLAALHTASKDQHRIVGQTNANGRPAIGLGWPGSPMIGSPAPALHSPSPPSFQLTVRNSAQPMDSKSAPAVPSFATTTGLGLSEERSPRVGFAPFPNVKRQTQPPSPSASSWRSSGQHLQPPQSPSSLNSNGNDGAGRLTRSTSGTWRREEDEAECLNGLTRPAPAMSTGPRYVPPCRRPLPRQWQHERASPASGSPPGAGNRNATRDVRVPPSIIATTSEDRSSSPPRQPRNRLQMRVPSAAPMRILDGQGDVDPCARAAVGRNLIERLGERKAVGAAVAVDG